jgi:hypothetical protein
VDAARLRDQGRVTERLAERPHAEAAL